MMAEDHYAFALHSLDLLLGRWPLAHRNQIRTRDAGGLVFTWFSAIEKEDWSALIVYFASSHCLAAWTSISILDLLSSLEWWLAIALKTIAQKQSLKKDRAGSKPSPIEKV